tara:strand:- start:67 stop:909 length:843 start_codon:yes stop_codon:yes gene_type:complete
MVSLNDYKIRLNEYKSYIHNMIKITHNYSGFFSCCAVKLNAISDFINSNKKLPGIVDSTELFILYKNDTNEDITFDYFEHYENVLDINIIYPIKYHHTDQFKNYATLDYTYITPLIKKYFSPSVEINEIISNIENKYNIVHANTVAVYYRGTDKFIETQLASFDAFYNQIIKIVNINKDINILLQTDSAKFVDYINDRNLKNIVIIDENATSYDNKGVHYEQQNTNYKDMFYFLSTIIILSKCKYIICSSGNCSIWIMFYRGNNENVIQYLNETWYNSVF